MKDASSIAFIVVVALMALAPLSSEVGNDVATHLVMAREICLGAKPYVDVADNNWPGFLLLYVPIAWLSGAHCQWFPVWISVLALLSAWTIYKFLRKITGEVFIPRLVTMVWLLCFLMPAYAAFTREHLLLLLGAVCIRFVYLGKGSRRSLGEGGENSRRSLGEGGYANSPWLWLVLGLAIIIKPNFGIFGVLLGLFFFLRRKSFKFPQLARAVFFFSIPVIMLGIMSWVGGWLDAFFKFGFQLNTGTIGNPGLQGMAQRLLQSSPIWLPSLAAASYLWQASDGDRRSRRILEAGIVLTIGALISPLSHGFTHLAYYWMLILAGVCFAGGLCISRCGLVPALACLVVAIPFGEGAPVGWLAILMLLVVALLISIISLDLNSRRNYFLLAVVVALCWGGRPAWEPGRWWWIIWFLPVGAVMARELRGAITPRLISWAQFALWIALASFVCVDLPKTWKAFRMGSFSSVADDWYFTINPDWRPLPPSLRDEVLGGAEKCLGSSARMAVLGIDSTFYLNSRLRPAVRLVHNPMWNFPWDAKPSSLLDLERWRPEIIIILCPSDRAVESGGRWRHPELSKEVVALLDRDYRVEVSNGAALVAMLNTAPHLPKLEGWNPPQ